MNAHACDGTRLRPVESRGRIVRFTCPTCDTSFFPIADMDTTTGRVYWFAAEPSQEMKQVASTASVATNLVRISESRPPLYDRILYVGADL
jgi:hypothetical protein